MGAIVFYFIGFFILMIILRNLEERAMKGLSTEQKAGLIDIFSKKRKYNLYITIGAVILFLLSLQFEWLPDQWIFALYFGIMLVYIAVLKSTNLKTLKANGYPEPFLKSMTLTAALLIVGIFLFFAMLYYDLFLRP